MQNTSTPFGASQHARRNGSPNSRRRPTDNHRPSATPLSPFVHRSWLEYRELARAALPYLPQLLHRWLPNGRRQGSEWVALNPRRNDVRLGSFKTNLRKGKWADFATGDRGGDVISLAAYLFDLSQAEAARRIAQMLGISNGGARHD